MWARAGLVRPPAPARLPVGYVYIAAAGLTRMSRLSDRDWFAPSTMLLVGAVLFFFPEPATSVLGAGLLLLGGAWWFYEWDRP